MTPWICGQPAALDCVSDCELHRLRAALSVVRERAQAHDAAFLRFCEALHPAFEELKEAFAYKGTQ